MLFVGKCGLNYVTLFYWLVGWGLVSVAFVPCPMFDIAHCLCNIRTILYICTSLLSGSHFCFVSRRSRVSFSPWRSAVRIVYGGFPQSLQENDG
jgi:hypothetical protein